MKISKPHIQALVAYFAWGVFPIYWKFLKHLSSLEILFHRVIWGFVFLSLVVLFSRNIKFAETLHLLKKHFTAIVSMAFLIGINWYIYIYAVNSGHILDGSLAYFMTPILNIVFGAWVFKERLSASMKIAAGIAGLGVALLIFLNGTFPWISISLAATFVIYGLLKKTSKVGGLESSFLETLIMIVPALIAAFFWRSSHPVELMAIDYLLLIFGGVISALPILLFSLSMKAVPLNHTGVMQFIGPSLQFLIGYFIYSEAVSNGRLFAFVLVWIGVALYIRDIWTKSKTPH